MGSLHLGGYPFTAGIKHYLERRYGLVSSSTYKEEERKLRYLAKVFRELKAAGRVSTTDPRKMERKDIQAFLMWMKENGLDPATQVKYLQHMKNYLRFFKNYVFVEMEADGVRFPKAGKKPIRTIERQDLGRILDTVEDMEGWHGSLARGMIALYFSTGVRPKELRLAHIEDLDMTRRRLFIRHPKGEGSWASSNEYVQLLRPDVDYLIYRYLEERDDRITSQGRRRAKFLFPRITKEIDTYYSANLFNKVKREVEDLSGVEFRLKDFRSTLASVTVNNDLSRLPAVSAQLRHTKLETTQKYYAQIQTGVAVTNQLGNVWAENPVREMYKDVQKPVIEKKFDYTGYV